MLFPTAPSATPYSLPFPKIGVRTPPKTPIAIISGTGKATNFKFGQNNNRVHPNKTHEKFERKGAWVYPGTAQIFWVPPIISETGKATDFKFGQYIQRVHPKKSPLKFFGKRERGCIQRLPNFFRVLPVISGTGKATNFKFCTHIYRLSRNKSPLKISGQVAMGVVRDSRKFSGHPYIGRIARSSLRFAQLSSPSMQLPIHFFRHFCCRMCRSTTKHTKKWTNKNLPCGTRLFCTCLQCFLVSYKL